MVGLSCSDILASSIYFLGTWLVPKGTAGQYGPVYGASGNQGTCIASGFFTQFSVCSPLYNGTLSLYYLLMIRFGWREDRLKRIEPIIHGLTISFALGTAIAGVALNLYGSVEWLCWVTPQENTWLYRWLFLFVPLWFCVAFVSVVMRVLWWKVRQREQAVGRFSTTAVQRMWGSQKKSTEIAVQGMLYIVSMYITWLFPSLQRVIELVAGKNYFVLQFFDAALLPLQGLFNALIYIRPRIRAYRRNNPNLNFWQAICKIRKTNGVSVVGFTGSFTAKSIAQLLRSSKTPIDDDAFDCDHSTSQVFEKQKGVDVGQTGDCEENEQIPQASLELPETQVKRDAFDENEQVVDLEAL